MWSIDLVRRRLRRAPASRPDRQREPVIIVVRTTAGVPRVARCCGQAAGAGVRREMTLAEARALLPECTMHVEPHVEPLDEHGDAVALKALANWALRFSPIVAADPPDGLLLDIAGCERLFRGERRLVELIANAAARLGIHARPATAPTFAAAWAVARHGETPLAIVPPGKVRETLAPLPVESLRLDEDTCTALREVAVDQVGHLLDLPRRDLWTRFGADLLRRLDEAMGRSPEKIESIRPVALPHVERVFDGPVSRLDAILLTVRGLVDNLVVELERTESGARVLCLDVDRADATPIRTWFRISRPSRSARHLWSLLAPKTEQLDLGFGVERIALRATSVGRLPHAQAERWRDDAGAPDGVHEQHLGELIDTLTDRLGDDRAVRINPVESHLPERTYRTTPVSSPPSPPSPPSQQSPPSSSRPSLLLDRPERIEVLALAPDGPPSWMRWRGQPRHVTSSFGPERIGAEWWRDRRTETRGCLGARDYFRVQDPNGQWLWVYRDLESGYWFVHGQWA
jgi:protein ImuB